MPSHYVFRGLGVPENVTFEEIRENLERPLRAGETLSLVERSLAVVPSCPPDDTSTCHFHVRTPLPQFLKDLKEPSAEPFAFALNGCDVTVDLKFDGLTQMYPTPVGKKILMDLIAVPGLDGHAYGSWKSKAGLERMWLRDFLPEHFPRCRVMTYGYDSNLRSRGVHTILDYSRGLLRALKDVRSSDEEKRRPLVFIGHSFGGILIAHTLVNARFEATRGDGHPDCLLKSTYGILFFGTPHRGMLIKNLHDILSEAGQHQRTGLLEEIQENSKRLRLELPRFIDLCPDFKIYTFYETNQTREIVIDDNNTWRRRGEYITAVSDMSAILSLPASIEESILVDADHSNLVKLASKHTRTYRDIRGILSQLQSEAPAIIEGRFRNGH